MTPPSRRRLTPDELTASLERASRKRQFRRRWNSDATIDELCDEFEMDEAELLNFAQSLGLGGRDCKSYIPSQEEIRLECAKIRSQWTETEREARLWGGRQGRMT
jgi:hypothetical protein